MQSNSVKKDNQLSPEELKFLSDWLPKGYEIIVSEKLGYSVNYVQRVKTGTRINVQISTLLTKLSIDNKKEIENFTA